MSRSTAVTGIVTRVMTPQGQLRGQKRLVKSYFDTTRSRQVCQRAAAAARQKKGPAKCRPWKSPEKGELGEV